MAQKELKLSLLKMKDMERDLETEKMLTSKLYDEVRGIHVECTGCVCVCVLHACVCVCVCVCVLHACVCVCVCVCCMHVCLCLCVYVV